MVSASTILIARCSAVFVLRSSLNLSAQLRRKEEPSTASHCRETADRHQARETLDPGSGYDLDDGIALVNWRRFDPPVFGRERKPASNIDIFFAAENQKNNASSAHRLVIRREPPL